MCALWQSQKLSDFLFCEGEWYPHLKIFIKHFLSYGYMLLDVFFLCMKEHICSISRLSRPHNTLETTGLPQKRNDSTWTQRKQKECIVLGLEESNGKERKNMRTGAAGSPRPWAKSPGSSCAQQGMLGYFQPVWVDWVPEQCPLIVASRRASCPRPCIPPEAGLLHCPDPLPWHPSNHAGILSLLVVPSWNWL